MSFDKKSVLQAQNTELGKILVLHKDLSIVSIYVGVRDGRGMIGNPLGWHFG